MNSSISVSLILFFVFSLPNQSLTNFYDFFKEAGFESNITTGSLATLLATMAMPVPICPEPTTPKDFTVENLNKYLSIINYYHSTLLLLHKPRHSQHLYAIYEPDDIDKDKYEVYIMK